MRKQTLRIISAFLPVAFLFGFIVADFAAAEQSQYTPSYGGGAIFTPNITGLTDSDLGLQYGAGTGLTNQDPRLLASRIIKASLQVLGIVDLVIIIYAGVLWMTAGGNEEKVTEAKKWIFGGIIGMIIILSAYSLVSFIISNLVNATVG